jgi:hypothetical protein
VEWKLRAKSATIVEVPKAIVIKSRASDIEPLDSIPMEERKREAGKPLYLTRYE